MKKTLFFAGFSILLFFFISPSFAQQGGGDRRNMDPKEMAERQTNQMKESLKLSAEQIPKVEALNLQYAEKIKVARDEAGDDRESMRSTMMEMMKEKDVEMKKILTAEQWTKFEADRKERMQNRGRGRRGI
jgi:protein CpxP